MEKVIKILLTFFGIILASYGIASIQLLPTIELVGHSIRSKGLPYDLVSWGSSTISTLKLFIAPFFFGNPFPEKYSYTGPGPNYFELSYFVGIIPILLIFFYLGKQIFLIFKSKKVDSLFFFYLISIVFFVLLSFGKNFFLHRFFYTFFPPYQMFRFPAQHLMIVVFLLAIVTGRVIDRLRIPPKVSIFLLFFITFELISFGKLFIRFDPIPIQSFDRKLIEKLQSDRGLFRVLPDYPVVSEVRKAIDFESAAYFQIQTTSGYNPIILNDYYRFIDLANKKRESSIPYYNVEIPPLDPYSPYLNFLNIKYLLTDTKNDLVANNTPNKKFQRIFDTKMYRLYENREVLPRFFLVSSASSYPSEQALDGVLLTGEVDLSKTVLLFDEDVREEREKLQINCTDSFAGDVEVLSYTPNRIKLRVQTLCNTFLSSSEVFYPGWGATIDGKNTKVYRSNSAFRAIFVPKGEHTVQYYFVPKSYYLGGVISLVTILMSFFIPYFLKRVTRARDSRLPRKRLLAEQEDGKREGQDPN